MFEEPGARSYLAGLNEAQRRAVLHGGGPLLVVAGAGTGKTKTLACRVAHLIAGGCPPERILLLTFTRRAAREMLRRAGRMSSDRAAGRVWGGTFHAVGNRLLRMYGNALGLPTNFTVMDQGDSADLMNLIRNELDLGRGKRRFPKKETLAAIYSRSVNTRRKLDAVLDADFSWCREEIGGIAAIFESYTERKRAQGVLDFDDLLLYWLAMMGVPKTGQLVVSMFEHVLIDEYQDTNPVQADILRSLRGEASNITAVGDDAQAIYSFRAATVRNILEFPEQFPGTNVVKLEQNYRSTQPILDVSNAVIASARRRYCKQLWSERAGDARPELITCLDEAQQSEAVCERVLGDRERGLPLKSQAILFRTGHHSAHLEIELARRNIPFVKYGGLRFVEAAHIKDILALLRILENPHDELAWFRVLQMLDGCGPATASKIMDALGVRNGAGPESPLHRLMVDAPPVPVAARAQLDELRAVIAQCATQAIANSPAAQVERLGAWCEPVFERLYDNPAARSADLKHLEQIAAGYTSRARFIAELALDPPASTSDLAGPPLLDDDYLILSTIHSAKGCEWDVVHIIHAADGMIPSDMATRDEEEIEEERRLFYVALTRARNGLCVYFPLRYYRRRMGLDDPHDYAQVTRFITREAAAGFEERCLAPAEDDDDPAVLPTAVSEVTDFLSELWRI